MWAADIYCIGSCNFTFRVQNDWSSNVIYVTKFPLFLGVDLYPTAKIVCFSVGVLFYHSFIVLLSLFIFRKT